MDAVREAAGTRRLSRWYYAAEVSSFLRQSDEDVLGVLTAATTFSVVVDQRDAWLRQIDLLRSALRQFDRGRLYLEFDIPRLGRRIDAVVVLDQVVFVIEFKIGERLVTAAARDQVWDYALDLRNFHETSHAQSIAPILVATEANAPVISITLAADDPLMPKPVAIGAHQLSETLKLVLDALPGEPIHTQTWERGRYRPTPTIIEAARALYANHSVEEIARSGAEARNLALTTSAIERVINDARLHRRKSICFVTGVPGAGKTLVGLDVATRHRDTGSPVYSVFLSGNAPLVAVLREALARDAVARAKAGGQKLTKKAALQDRTGGRQSIQSFIQIIHHFRDDCLRDSGPPVEHVALFDEAQRAWSREQTAKFMRTKKKLHDFDESEPE